MHIFLNFENWQQQYCPLSSSQCGQKIWYGVDYGSINELVFYHLLLNKRNFIRIIRMSTQCLKTRDYLKASPTGVPAIMCLAQKWVACIEGGLCFRGCKKRKDQEKLVKCCPSRMMYESFTWQPLSKRSDIGWGKSLLMQNGTPYCPPWDPVHRRWVEGRGCTILHRIQPLEGLKRFF